MARTREVGTLWIGGPLTWLEQVCLKSFVDKGQKITLFSYEDIPNVPEGVIRRDGREIIDTDDFIKYERKNSYALFADLFRLHMIHKCPGMIWIDTDVYCHRPADYDDDYVMGFEFIRRPRVNNAVLGLPHDCALLKDLLEFTSDRYSIPTFFSDEYRASLAAEAEAGRPVHISKLPWGVWGPIMLTHFVPKHDLLDKVQPVDAFYPVLFRQRGLFMKGAHRAEEQLTERTTLLHLWASNKRQLGNFHYGLPPNGSYYDKIVRAHQIIAPLAPIRGRARTVFDGALSDDLDQDHVSTAADLTGNARTFLLALYHRFQCDIYLLNVARKGVFVEGELPWIAPYRTFLIERDVPEDKIHVITSETELRQFDVLCNLNGFGVSHKLVPLQSFLTACMHENSRVFTDLLETETRLNFLEKYGVCDVLWTEQNEKDETLLRLRLKPHAAQHSDPELQPDDKGKDE